MVRTVAPIHKVLLFMSNIRFTAANLSRIKKPSSNPKKGPLSPLRSKPKPKQKVKKQDEEDGSEEPLQVISLRADLDFQIQNYTGIVDAIDTVVENQWAEKTCFHNRYYSEEAKEGSSSTDLLFSLRGLSMETKAEIIKYRNQQLPNGMLTLNQLYSMFQDQGNTFVDRSLEMCIRDGLVKKFIITNALPIILRTGKGGQNSKVTYGYENIEVVVKIEHYIALIEEIADSLDEATAAALREFKEFVEGHPEALSICTTDISADHLSALVKTGVVTLTSNHHNEINVHQYSLAYPRCGTFLKMINSGRSWLVKTLSKSKFKELLEEQLFDKWEGKNKANFRKPFYGYDLMWVLADALGAGVAEVFKTPVGRGWRLTGKI